MLPPDRREIRLLPRSVSEGPAYPKRSAGRARERGQSVVEFSLVLPIMVFLLLAIVDFARIYTTMMSVESAAREAADFGTTLGAEKWQTGSQKDTTVLEMVRRACIASSNLPDYEPDADSAIGCTNPSFTYCMTPPSSTSCISNPDPTALGCDVATLVDPCTVTLTLSYVFHTFAPVNIEFFGRQLGLPSTITFDRDSTFAMTDIDLTAPPPP